MPRHATAVLATLVGAADDDILDLVSAETALRDDLGDDLSEHVVGPQPGERAGVASKRAAQTGVKISLEHGSIPPSIAAFPRARASLSSAGKTMTGGASLLPELRVPSRSR